MQEIFKKKILTFVQWKSLHNTNQNNSQKSIAFNQVLIPVSDKCIIYNIACVNRKNKLNSPNIYIKRYMVIVLHL